MIAIVLTRVLKHPADAVATAYGAAGRFAPRGPVQDAAERLLGRIPIARAPCFSSWEYGRERSLEWRVAAPSENQTRAAPLRFGDLPVDFSCDLESTLPELGVVDLPQPYVLGPSGWILTADGVMLMQHGYHNVRSENPVWPKWSGRIRRLSGRAVSLVSDWGGVNYCHLLLDSLGKIAVLEAAGTPWRNADHFIIPLAKLPILGAYLKRLDIPPARWVVLEPGVTLRPERLWAPTYPGLRRNYSALLAGLRGWAGDESRPRRRVYIARSAGPRTIVNDDAVWSVLDRAGFERYDPTGKASQPEDFASFDAVVAAHGAASANIVFCRPGTAVVELFPANYTPSYYYTLSAAIGLRYACMAGRPVRGIRIEGNSLEYWDFEIDVTALAGGLDRLLR